MKKTTYITACVLAGCLLTAQARKWTSADDATKTFEAEFVESADGKVTVKRKNGRNMTFALEKLSKGDQEFVAKQIEAKKAAAEADKLKDAPLPKALSGKLVKRSGSSVKKYDLSSQGAVPKYYLMYYSASW